MPLSTIKCWMFKKAHAHTPAGINPRRSLSGIHIRCWMFNVRCSKNLRPNHSTLNVERWTFIFSLSLLSIPRNLLPFGDQFTAGIDRNIHSFDLDFSIAFHDDA